MLEEQTWEVYLDIDSRIKNPTHNAYRISEDDYSKWEHYQNPYTKYRLVRAKDEEQAIEKALDIRD